MQELREILLGSRTVDGILANVAEKIKPRLKEDAAASPAGSAVRAEKALREMHEEPIVFEIVDDLMQVRKEKQKQTYHYSLQFVR